MRPFKVFIFLAFIAGAVTILALFFPSLLRYDLQSEAEIWLRSPISVIETPPEEHDSLPIPVVAADTVTLGEATTDTLLFPLKQFHDKLDTGTSRVRIMVFGDSQLEGDRLSSYIRSVLRDRYGGTGPGLLQPLMPVMYTRSVDVRSSSNWKRYNYISYRNGDLPHKKLGPFMAICRFLPPDSLSASAISASFRVTPSIFSDSLSARYDSFKLFYGNLKGECTITISTANVVLTTASLQTGDGPYEFFCDTYGVSDLRVGLSGYGSPDIYGFSIESDNGVAVDNIPHRGSAGLEFTMVDKTNLKNIFSLINPDLIILHYGLNVVRNVRSDYSYYQKGLERQFKLLREIHPDAEILLMGLTDMADNTGGTMTSFPNIAKIRDAQQAAAKSVGIGFWDSWEAMGGDNSINRWVAFIPPLAQTDHTHLTYTGSDSLASLFVSEMLIQQPIAEIEESVDSITPEVMPIVLTADFQGLITDNTDGPLSPLNKIVAILEYDPLSPFIFTNIAFWVFLLFLLAGYSIIGRKPFIRNLYLFVFSLFFYYKSGGFFLILLIVSTITDYAAGRLIYRSVTRRGKLFWLLVSLFVNLGMLAYFKYYEFIIRTINDIAGIALPATDVLAVISNDFLGTSFDISSVVLPVGISFFTFQTISYTVDVYRGKVMPVKNIIDFGFYVSFFPQLVAGPIVRASEFVPQLYQKFLLTKREFGHALFLIGKGLIKKMIISDYISVNFVDRVFGAPEVYSGAENLVAVYGYGLQIYCDFSGYTDIAIGVALLMGFRLPVNFNSPYKATGVADFWRRWHISLSRWLKDYLYIPLGGNRKGGVRTGLNLLITMALGGLWHGASGRFVIWGLLHGIGLVINKIWVYLLPPASSKNRLITILQILITFNFISFAWIFFRAESNEMAFLMIRNIFTGFDVNHIIPIWHGYPLVVMAIIIGYLIHFLPERVKEATRGLFVRMPVVVMLVSMVLLAVVLIRMQTAGIQPFIYFRF